MAPKEALRATSLYAQLFRSILDHPHPYPPHKGVGVETATPVPAAHAAASGSPSGGVLPALFAASSLSAT